MIHLSWKYPFRDLTKPKISDFCNDAYHQLVVTLGVTLRPREIYVPPPLLFSWEYRRLSSFNSFRMCTQHMKWFMCRYPYYVNLVDHTRLLAVVEIPAPRSTNIRWRVFSSSWHNLQVPSFFTPILLRYILNLLCSYQNPINVKHLFVYRLMDGLGLLLLPPRVIWLVIARVFLFICSLGLFI